MLLEALALDSVKLMGLQLVDCIACLICSAVLACS